MTKHEMRLSIRRKVRKHGIKFTDIAKRLTNRHGKSVTRSYVHQAIMGNCKSTVRRLGEINLIVDRIVKDTNELWYAERK
jgi:glycine cleavage system protein P-like pyridoxal-binding family